MITSGDRESLYSFQRVCLCVCCVSICVSVCTCMCNNKPKSGSRDMSCSMDRLTSGCDFLAELPFSRISLARPVGDAASRLL